MSFRSFLLASSALLTATLAASAPAAAQSWNLYSGTGISVGLASTTDNPTGAMGPNNYALVNILLPSGSIDARHIAPVIMDTGSTGIIVGSNHFDITGRTAVGTDSHAFSAGLRMTW